ncbi:MAG: HTH domain-containing protein [bacterium]|nr:HTH domain-containing protein [bacterium]
MKKLILPIHPRLASQKILRFLPNKRLRDVMERRYGLASGKKETLEAIGKSYGITRERVRQIEEDSLRRLRVPSVVQAVEPLYASLNKHMEEHGGVVEEKKLLNSVAEPKLHPHVSFLLTLSDGFNRKAEDSRFHTRWYTKNEALKLTEAIVEKTVGEIDGIKKPISGQQLFTILRNHAKATLGDSPSADTLDSYLSISKLVAQNPYGEFGLRDWATINPSGVRDKAYVVLAKTGEPLHFRAVAQAIDKAGWSKKKAHPQTVHNELIKDSRFVLVGRGLYALKEWGYEPGTVVDVVVSVLKHAARPLPKEEIVRRVLEKRRVKENTVLLNLQNKKHFKRVGEGYSLA